ncbi:cell division protein PerM [Streptacidiphilus cavernicola]|uniref:DUF6350 family protein n=1 Tax=Streptacidiphilus cavernicola TaxID=3342716 RepID=A0ABV6VTH8_9ACTN
MAFLMERLRPAVAGRPGAGIDVPSLRGGLLGGAVAAGFGLATVAVPILLLWIVTPYVVQGPGGVVHLAACVWLLAHGAGLVRSAMPGSPEYGGPGVPLAVTPLLVTVLVLVPLYRAAVRLAAAAEGTAAGEAAAREAVDDDGWDDEDGQPRPTDPGPGRVRSVLLGLVAGYLLVAALLVAVAATGSTSVASPLGAFGWTVLAALPVAALGVRRGAGPGCWGALPGSLPGPGLLSRIRTRTRTRTPLPSRPAWLSAPAWLRLPAGLSASAAWLRLPSWSTRSAAGRSAAARSVAGWPGRTRAPGAGAAPGALAVAGRGALGGAVALLGAGGVVLAAALVAHFGAAGTVAAQTAPDLAGRLALLLLCVAVLPNAVVWGTAYAAGPGFVLGGWLAPLGGGAGAFTAANAPAFPLFAALPGPDRTLLGLLTPVLVLTAGPVVAAITARAAVAHQAGPESGLPGRDRGLPDLDDPDGWDEPGHPDDLDRRWGPLATAGVALAAALGAGLLVGLCAAASGGSLGTAALAQVGPSPWRTGLAALGWTAALGVPGAVLLRWWWLRCRRSAA